MPKRAGRIQWGAASWPRTSPRSLPVTAGRRLARGRAVEVMRPPSAVRVAAPWARPVRFLSGLRRRLGGARALRGVEHRLAGEDLLHRDRPLRARAPEERD